MKLGAQLFSVRQYLKTEEDLSTTFQKIKTMGYENVQLSGAAPFPAELIREVSQSSGLPIVCTHTAPDRILNETEQVIAEHKIFGCPVMLMFLRMMFSPSSLCASTLSVLVVSAGCS